MDPTPFTARQLIAILAPTAGEERARELVREVLGTLGIKTETFSTDEAIQALELLGKMPGVVATVTKFAMARLRLKAAADVQPARLHAPMPPQAPTAPPPSPAPGRGGPMARAALVELLAPNLGQEKAQDAVDEAARKLAHAGDTFTMEQALRLLEAVTEAPGIVGITARFAKARLLMKGTA